jgi:D-alanyl-D-alanine dipeptidase
MSDHLNELIDVAALSQKECTRPIHAKLLYATAENFLGRPVDGYTPAVTDLALMTKDAAAALCKVQNELLQKHKLGLIIYDSYRPLRAVLDFVAWSKEPVPESEQGEIELARKKIHYPNIEKEQMFELGYVSKNSQHCYGHTVDLMLINEHGKELNHGAGFDFMDTLSHVAVMEDKIGAEAYKNRHILFDAMQKFGFITYPYEFWHFNFNNKMVTEPMDLVITAELRSLNV